MQHLDHSLYTQKCMQPPLLVDQNILKCASLNRIKIILDTFKSTMSDTIENQSTFIRQINNVFNNDYTKSKLLHDFYHIKYYHHVDANNNEFDKIFHYLTKKNVKCDIQKCNYIQRYYIDRTKLFNEYKSFNDENEDNKLSILYQQLLQ
eukprot:209759_1